MRLANKRKHSRARIFEMIIDRTRSTFEFQDSSEISTALLSCDWLKKSRSHNCFALVDWQTVLQKYVPKYLPKVKKFLVLAPDKDI